MTTLPTGIVTFLLTDIEASTRRWEQEPDAMREAMTLHDALFDRAVEAHDGVIVKPRGEGDSRFSVFPRATDAVAAAAEFQQAAYASDWPTESPLRVRIAIHTGEADLRGGDYYGSTVNRCARLRSLAFGGQTLLSLATAQLVRESLPTGASLRDLGQHRLKDLSFPEHVFQLVIPEVPGEFPPLASLDRHPTNLPVQATPFIGREHEIKRVREWLLDPGTRLVTLTGPGGSGKTRLGLQVAASVVDEFPDGVFLIPLETVRDPDLIIQSVVQAVGVRESSGVDLLQNLNEFLRDKSMLLVFDNFERLVSAAPQLSALLASNPTLKMLVTSREALRVQGEHELSVPSLSLPGPVTGLSPDQLMKYEAISLFVSRAKDVKPGFELTSENAAAVVGICQRLDGLPLAIELAAARVRLFPPQALLKRLDHSLSLLTGGARDLPERQQTLRAAISWSHELLDDQERKLFRRLSVFAGGFTLDAAVAVTVGVETNSPEMLSDSSNGAMVESDHDPWQLSIEVFDGVEALLSKSLLRQQQSTAESGEEPRFGMLETIREFGLEQLEASGELGVVRHSHAQYFLMLSEMAEPELQGSEQGLWLERLEDEHRNLRAAMSCALDAGDAGLGLRLTSALWPFWEVRGYFTEGRNWTERMLTLGGEPKWRAKTLTGAGTMAWLQGDVESATTYHDQALELYQQLNDEEGIASALKNLGVQAALRNDVEQSDELFNESLKLFRGLGEETGVADVLNNLGILATSRGQYERAERLLYDSLSVRQRLGDNYGAADTLNNLGDNEYYQKLYDKALLHYHESLRLYRDTGSLLGILRSLVALASIAAAQGHTLHGARLTGAIDALLEQTGIAIDEEEHNRLVETRNALKIHLGEEAYKAPWEEGKQLSLAEAIDHALFANQPVASNREYGL